MRTSVRLIFIVLIISLAGASGWNGARAQSNSRYFGETGHSVVGDFLSFYQRVPNPELIYGYPITDSFQDATTGLQVQYFQKARFELHTSEPADQRVQLTPLGKYLYQPGQPELALDGAAGCRAFARLPYQVCYTFLDFFDEHGGLGQFGLPISNLERHNGVTVQYFERARFEWRPGMGNASTVVLTDLGTQYFYDQKENPALLTPARGSFTGDFEDIKNLQVRAFPAAAVTRLRGDQTVFVLVQDQRSLPVQGADIRLVLRLPSGQNMVVIAPSPTNENGITQIPFSFSSNLVGMAGVEIIATIDGMEARTLTSFRIWW